VIGQQLHEKHSQMNLSYETKPQKKKGSMMEVIKAKQATSTEEEE
jgi:hypothetical protein